MASLEVNAVAYEAYLAKPDFIFIPGDMVYGSDQNNAWVHICRRPLLVDPPGL